MLLESIYTAANFSHVIDQHFHSFVGEHHQLESDQWEITKIINFFDKNARLQILQNIPNERNLRLVSVVTLQSVSQSEDDPTFLFEVYNRSNKRLFSGLAVVKNQTIMSDEANKLMKLLEPMMVALQKPKDESDATPEAINSVNDVANTIEPEPEVIGEAETPAGDSVESSLQNEEPIEPTAEASSSQEPAPETPVEEDGDSDSKEA